MASKTPAKESECVLEQGILYVADVVASAAKYAAAFDTVPEESMGDMYCSLKQRDGKTAHFAFTSLKWGREHIAKRMQTGDHGGKMMGVEVSFRAADVDGVFARALAQGFASMKEPFTIPSGTRMGYLRDSDGHVVSVYSAASDSSSSTKSAAAAEEPATTDTKASKKAPKAKKAAPKAKPAAKPAAAKSAETAGARRGAAAGKRRKAADADDDDE